MTSPPTPVLRMTGDHEAVPGHRRARRRRPRARARQRSTACSARTAPASRRCSRSSPATTGRARARSSSTASRSRSTARARARELGIGIVYQELSLLPNLSVAHNISLGSEPTHGLRDRRAARCARRRGEALGRDRACTPIDPGRKVAELSLAERQLVEIAKVLTLQPPARARLRRADDGAQPPRRRAPVPIMRALRDDGRRRDLRQPPLPRGARDLRRLDGAAQRARRRPRRARARPSLERLVELTLGQKAEAAFARELARARPTAERRARGARRSSIGVARARRRPAVRRGEIVGLCGLLGLGAGRGRARRLSATRATSAGSVRS